MQKLRESNRGTHTLTQTPKYKGRAAQSRKPRKPIGTHKIQHTKTAGQSRAEQKTLKTVF
jgi:hypothetical protein